MTRALQKAAFPSRDFDRESGRARRKRRRLAGRRLRRRMTEDGGGRSASACGHCTDEVAGARNRACSSEEGAPATEGRGLLA